MINYFYFINNIIVINKYQNSFDILNIFNTWPIFGYINGVDILILSISDIMVRK